MVYLFAGAEIIDGEADCPYAGDVLVEGRRIKRVAKRPDQIWG